MKTITDINMVDTTLQEQCSQFAEILDLDEPVSEEVLKAALLNENYARNLLLSKESPELLAHLLQNPIHERVGDKEHSNVELIGKAAVALLKWSKTGFTMVNPVVLERRENACMACPNLREPKSALQKMIPSSALKNTIGHRTGKKACDLCGCNVAKKMRLPSEACPDLNPENNSETRWGEPVQLFQKTV